MFSPEEQRIIDERWKQYDAEWKQPQPMSRDQTALEIEKFRYETEARYREDQLRQSWKNNEHDTSRIRGCSIDRRVMEELYEVPGRAVIQERERSSRYETQKELQKRLNQVDQLYYKLENKTQFISIPYFIYGVYFFACLVALCNLFVLIIKYIR